MFIHVHRLLFVSHGNRRKYLSRMHVILGHSEFALTMFNEFCTNRSSIRGERLALETYVRRLRGFPRVDSTYRDTTGVVTD